MMSMKNLPLKDVWSVDPLEGEYHVAEILPRDQHEFLEMHIRLNTLDIRLIKVSISTKPFQRYLGDENEYIFMIFLLGYGSNMKT